MKRTFNMGIGFAMIVPDRDAVKAIALLKKAGYRAFLIGHMEKGVAGVQYA
jgi:phosphoribosylformylglycinamidine cyclo-ligase